MSYITWILVGGIAGWIASIIMGNNAEQGIFGNIIAGVLGAFIGGWIMNFFNAPGVTGFDFRSIAVAVIGAVIFIGLKRKLL